MDDMRLIDLFFARNEAALSETESRYGSYCLSVASRILPMRQDAEEVVNDVYLSLWKTIPPQRPERMDAFLGKITRNLAIDRKRHGDAAKRGSGEYALAYQEIEPFLQSRDDPVEQMEAQELTEHIESFLLSLPVMERRVFLRRYWHFQSVGEISEQLGYSVSKTRTMLYRTRKKLRTYLKNRGVIL